MRKIFLRIGVLIFTLAFGVAVVKLSETITTQTFETSQIEITSDRNLTENTELWEKGLIRIYLKDGKLDHENKNYVDVYVDDLKRFMEFGRGCGESYVQSYVTDDGYFVAEGGNPFTRNKLNKEIKEAQKIIEKVENAKNRNGEKGLRIVLQSLNKETGKTFYQIIWYKNGRMMWISAPTLELALEFENSDAYVN